MVSVIIPTYNRAWSIERSISSVLNQSFSDLELIIVDDGSTDNTQDVISKFKDGRIKYFFIKNSGVSTARNFGIKKSKFNLIAFLDSDDEWLPNKLEEQINLYRKQSYVLCHTDEIWIRNGKRVNPMNKHKKEGGDVFEKSLSLCCISPSSVVIEKKILEEFSGFDESLKICEDYDLWLRICSKYKVQYVDKKLLIKYGGHSDQLSGSWGNDVYRVKSILKLIETNTLSKEQEDKAIKKINEKCQILIKGFKKRNNLEANYYLEILNKFSN